MRILAALLFFLGAAAQAAVGLTELPGVDGDGPVTVFYLSSGEAKPLKRGPFDLALASQGAPVPGNGRLIAISHGSGGSPWVHADLARVLVDAGFVVVLPEHRGDNYKDSGTPAMLARHCATHIALDFPACVGLATRLSGNFLDSVKIWTALTVIGQKFSDPTWVNYSDPRVQAVVAAVPYAADFDLASLASPRVPLGLVNMGQDRWLSPRFHGEAVLKSCAAKCVSVASLPGGGHGALLSPFPPKLSDAAAELLNDPPGFDRSVLPETDRKIAAFFRTHLLP